MWSHDRIAIAMLLAGMMTLFSPPQSAIQQSSVNHTVMCGCLRGETRIGVVGRIVVKTSRARPFFPAPIVCTGVPYLGSNLKRHPKMYLLYLVLWLYVVPGRHLVRLTLSDRV